MMFGYDAETDTLRIVLSSAPIAESDEDKPGVILDYDAAGNIVGIEVLQASRRTDNPSRIEMLPA
jgi:YD repeat-containing protein